MEESSEHGESPESIDPLIQRLLSARMLQTCGSVSVGHFYSEELVYTSVH